MIAFSSADHHGSHEELLQPIEPGPAGKLPIDAVIVPTARQTNYLRPALRLARDLGCPLLALCSREAEAPWARDLGIDLGTEVVALDFVPKMSRWTPDSDRLLASESVGTGADVSMKRNLALVLGKAVGWRRVLFVDDDIDGVDPADVEAAAGGLDELAAVGLRNVGFPDNSVVCHAFSHIGGDQRTFIGGGALVVDPQQATSFFPSTYCQDWMFYLGTGVPLRLGVTGQARQRAYDPFARIERASVEEFGDFFAEGLFRLLDDDTWAEHTSEAYWQQALDRRRRLIAHVTDELNRRASHDQKAARMLDSLAAAGRKSALITPGLCVDYVRMWKVDLEVWRARLNGIKTGHESIESALAVLGLGDIKLFHSGDLAYA